MTLRLAPAPGLLCIARLPAGSRLPPWLDWSGPLTCVCRTEDELSIVCRESAVPEQVQAERGWRAFKVEGPIDFSSTGVMAALSAPLAEAGVSLFAVSTYDTDYVLVRARDFERAMEVLSRHFRVCGDDRAATPGAAS